MKRLFIFRQSFFMLYLVLTISLLLIIISGLGKLYQHFVAFHEERISTNILLGISITTGIWTFLAFFVPINFIIEIIFCLLGLGSFIYFKIYKKLIYFFRRQSRFFYFCIATTLLAGSFYPFILDHFGYYIPTISWLKEFGIVKGISNLDMLMGQYSTWHIFQSGFSTFVDTSLRINTFLIIVFIIYIFETRFWNGLIFAPFFFLFAQSPSPDLPILIFAFIIIKDMFGYSRNAKFLLLLASFALSIKPTSFWLLIFVFLYFWVVKRNRIITILPGFCFLILYLFKNIWAFGHPFFPIGFPDLGLPWQPNSFLLEDSRQTSLELSYDLQYSYESIKNFTTWDYIVNWLNLDGIKGFINKAFVLSLISLLILAFIKKRKILSILTLSIFLKSILILIFSAQYRLFLDVFLVLGIIVFSKTWYSFAKVAFTGMSVIIFWGLIFPKSLQTLIPSFKLGATMMAWEKFQLLRPAYFELNQYKTYQIGNLKFNVVKNYPFSFDTPLPAISPDYLNDYKKAGIFPQTATQDLKSGFIWKKLSPKELQDLQQIINKTYP